MGEKAANSSDPAGKRPAALVAGAAAAPLDAAGGLGAFAVAAAVGAALALAALAAWRWLRARSPLRALRQALAVAADWHWTCDARLTVTALQTGQRPLPDLDPRQLLGRRPWEIEAGLPPPAALAAATGACAPFYDVPVSTRGGRTFLLSGLPRFDADGRFEGYCGVAREVSALLAAARADAAPPAQWLAEHAARTRQLELAVRELDSFAHSVSHDLRAPLRVVDGFAQIVLEDYGDRLDDLGREHLKRIVAAAGRMNAMIDTLLSLARMTSREIVRERVDLARLAQELADEFGVQYEGRHAFVAVAAAPVDGDRTLLRLVLQNLLGNAFKFSARVPAPRVEFGVREENGRAVYFVRDNGAGFDMRFADKLFGLFQRFHSQNEFPGTGVGLATVQRIVRKHGGRVWAESAPGQGATFFFTLWEDGAPG
ncbi:MAG: ATP-binding protein [Burkholderiaceae bacterium]|nr:ATP-binding protein [Burkholderiaceae bacterium]